VNLQLNLIEKSLVHFPFLRKQKFIVSIIIVFFWIWSFPNTLSPVDGGLDSSWVIGIHIAKLQNFVWGTDIVWTYGPLGYLFFPINIDNELWTQSVAFWIIMHSLFFLVLNFFLIKTKFPIRNAIIFGFFLVIFLKYPPIYLPLIGMLLGFFLYLQFYKKNYFVLPLTFSTAFLMYTKFDLGLGVLSILLLSCIYLLIKKSWKEPVFLLTTYFGFLVLIWATIGNPVNQILNYFSSSLDIASGYSIGVSIDVAPDLFLLFPVSAGVLILFWTKEYYKNSRENLKFLLISPVVVFFFYKIGFVRSDPPHLMYSFLLFSGFFLILIFLDKKSTNRLLRFSTYGFVILLTFTGIIALSAVQIYFEENTLNVSGSLQRSIKLITAFYTNSNLNSFLQELEYFNDESFSPIRDTQKQKIIQEYPLSQKTIDLLNNNNVDVIPWDIAQLYALGFNYHPRPVFQSQSTYTSTLDETNARFFEKESSPQFVLYEKKSIDGRFPTFEDPATLRTLICHYSTVGFDESTLILEKNNKNSCDEEKVIATQEGRFNERISVPSSQGYIFAKISVNQNLLGKLLSYFYKPPQIFIKVNDESTYRFIYPTAENGILLSSGQELKNDCSLILEDVTSFQIIDEFQQIDPSQRFSGNTKFILLSPEMYFENIIKIEFMEINPNLTTIPTCEDFN